MPFTHRPEITTNVVVVAVSAAPDAALAGAGLALVAANLQ